MTETQLNTLYKARLDFIEKAKNEKNPEYNESINLKKDYTFHFLQMKGSEPWFDLFKKPFIKHPAKF